jgi:hypothetical protein
MRCRGAFVGAIPILNRLRKNGKDEWRPRDCEQLSEQIGEHYGLPIDMSSKTGGVRAIAGALNEGDVARAQIATVLLGIPDPPALSKGACSRDALIRFIRDLHWSGLIKLDGDESLPAGEVVTSNNTEQQRHALTKAGYNPDEPRDERGRWTNGTGGSVEPDTAGRSPRIQLADAGTSDASDDPVAEAAARAAAAARRNTGTAYSQAKPVDSDHEDFWQALGSRLSHEAKSALWEIGRTQIDDSNANLAIATDEANVIAHALRAYGDYRSKPWIGRDGLPVQVPVIDTGDPLSDRAALMGHNLFEPNAPLTRPGTNADWIDPLINLASVGAMAAGPALRLTGPVAEALGSVRASELSADAAERAKGSFSVSDWSGYPSGLSRPTGPFRLLNGDEYDAARAAANSANRALREADPVAYAGKEIHEIHPVKFGGSPTDPANKIALTPGEHTSATTWWARLKRDIPK